MCDCVCVIVCVIVCARSFDTCVMNRLNIGAVQFGNGGKRCVCARACVVCSIAAASLVLSLHSEGEVALVIHGNVDGALVVERQSPSLQHRRCRHCSARKTWGGEKEGENTDTQTHRHTHPHTQETVSKLEVGGQSRQPNLPSPPPSCKHMTPTLLSRRTGGSEGRQL